jgi:signal transduction histidine kinase
MKFSRSQAKLYFRNMYGDKFIEADMCPVNGHWVDGRTGEALQMDIDLTKVSFIDLCAEVARRIAISVEEQNLELLNDDPSYICTPAELWDSLDQIDHVESILDGVTDILRAKAP